jgi:hypothetical protein
MPFVEDAEHPVVVFDCERHGRDHRRRVSVAGASRAGEDRSAVGALRSPRHLVVAGDDERVAPAVERGGDPFVGEELLHLVRQTRSASAALGRRRRRRWNRHRHRFLQERVVPPLNDDAFEHPDLADGLRERDLAGELAPVPLEIRFRADVHADHVGSDRSRRAGRPRSRNADERKHLRLDHVGAEPQKAPPFAEWPFLLVHAGESPSGQLLHDPVGRLAHGGRALEARAVDVGEPADVIQGLGVIQSFIANLRVHGVVEPAAGALLSGQRHGQRAAGSDRDQSSVHDVTPCLRNRNAVRPAGGASVRRPAAARTTWTAGSPGTAGSSWCS